jgi:hypothetical protein
VEGEEKQRQLSHASHRPLEISQKARDSHIPTAELRGHGKVENQKQVSHFPTTARNHHQFSFSEPKNQKKGLGRCAASPFPPSVLPSGERTDFMLIFQLENAPKEVANPYRVWSDKLSVFALI